MFAACSFRQGRAQKAIYNIVLSWQSKQQTELPLVQLIRANVSCLVSGLSWGETDMHGHRLHTLWNIWD